MRLTFNYLPWANCVAPYFAGAEKAAHNGGMTHDTIDLAFLGVHGVWNTDLGPHHGLSFLSKN